MMDTDIDPSTFDLVVVGTGLPESIIAGAAAQAGKSVLHLDPADNYGSHWATLQLDAFSEWAQNGGTVLKAERESQGAEAVTNTSQAPTPSANEATESELEVVALSASAPLYSDFALQVGTEGVNRSTAGLPHSVGAAKKYCVDLAGPRLALAAGPLVDLLIQCGAHNYLEFKAVDGSYTWRDGQLEAVPSSRADVFKSRSLSLVEKRHLTKFFKLVTEATAEGGSSEGGEGVPEEDLGMLFADFLTKHNLPAPIRQSLLYSVALLNRDQDAGAPLTTREGLAAITAYLHSVGRFGPGVGAFLYPLYGGGELPQAFCRIAAVKGALYVLRRGICALLLDISSRRLRGVVTSTGQTIRTSKLVTGPGLLRSIPSLDSGASSDSTSDSSATNEKGCVARCVCVTDASLTPGQSNVLVNFPPRSLSEAHPAHPVRVLQVGESAAACPPGRFLVQFSIVSSEGRSIEEDLQPVVEALFDTHGGANENSREEGGEENGSQTSAAVEGSGNKLELRDGAGATDWAEQLDNGMTARGGNAVEEGRSSSGVEAATSEPSFEPTLSVAETVKGGDAAGNGSVETDGQRPRTPETAALRASDGGKPRLLWSAYFKQRTAAGRELAGADIYVCGSPDEGLTFGNVTEEAETAFKRLFPGLPYFPQQAAEPEEAAEGDEDGE